MFKFRFRKIRTGVQRAGQFYLWMDYNETWYINRTFNDINGMAVCLKKLKLHKITLN